MRISGDQRASIYQAWLAAVAPSLVATKLRLNLKTVIKHYVEFDNLEVSNA